MARCPINPWCVLQLCRVSLRLRGGVVAASVPEG